MTNTELKTLRKQASLTQVELATMLLVHPVTVSRWENGERKIDFLTGIAIKRIIVPLTKGAIK